MKSSFVESVNTLLGAWNPSCETQQEYKALFLDMLTEQTCARSCVDPGHITASGFVRTEDFSNICLIFHPRFRKWIQPGGHIDAADTDVLCAARREVLEETGLDDIHWDGTIRLDIHEVPKTAKQDSHLHFDIQLGFVAEHVPLYGDVRGEWVSWVLFEPSKSDESVLRFLEGWR